MSSPLATDIQELELTDEIFGGEAAVRVGGPLAEAQAFKVMETLHEVNRRLSRFRADSDLAMFNRDPRDVVPVGPMMLDLAEAITYAGERSDGLVDCTVIDAVEHAGYRESMRPITLDRIEWSPGDQRPRAASPSGRWRLIESDRDAMAIRRREGVRVDSGGVGKGLAADLAGRGLREALSFCVNCCGDLLIGGRAALPRRIEIEHPLNGGVAARLRLSGGGVATSGIIRRSWTMPGGGRAHHVIDPGSGLPAFTGLIQATAIAPTALEAEVLAKAALLSGPARGPRWLTYGGVLVHDGGRVQEIKAARSLPETSEAA